MALHPSHESLAREYVGLLLTDPDAREEAARFPEHDESPDEYHAKMADLVNRRLRPQTPLTAQNAEEFHRHVADRLAYFRSNLREHTAGEEKYTLACDGFECGECPT
ncbi:MAG TPA: hypothetical protein VIO32_00860 [Candidatus Baltobacteraceae bacterium]